MKFEDLMAEIQRADVLVAVRDEHGTMLSPIRLSEIPREVALYYRDLARIPETERY